MPFVLVWVKKKWHQSCWTVGWKVLSNVKDILFLENEMIFQYKLHNTNNLLLLQKHSFLSNSKNCLRHFVHTQISCTTLMLWVSFCFRWTVLHPFRVAVTTIFGKDARRLWPLEGFIDISVLVSSLSTTCAESMCTADTSKLKCT